MLSACLIGCHLCQLMLAVDSTASVAAGSLVVSVRQPRIDQLLLVWEHLNCRHPCLGFDLNGHLGEPWALTVNCKPTIKV